MGGCLRHGPILRAALSASRAWYGNRSADEKKAILAVLRAHPDPMRRIFGMSESMRIFDPDKRYPILQTALSDSDASVRENALEYLAKMNDFRAVPLLVKGLADASEPNRLLAVTTLGGWGKVGHR